MTSPIELSRLHSLLLTWYRRQGRRLPWRNISNPYRVLVSEIMLQQTQVSRVLQKYPAFLAQFPTFRTLADARTSEVIKAWRGLGYNNRAVRLQRLARIVTDRYRGRLPVTVEELLELPGIGPYTAHAIASFAHRRPVATVDTNIRRVLMRLYPAESAREGIWWTAASVLPRRNAYDWNQALMDLGAMACTSSSPSCQACPLRSLCPSAGKIPVPAAKRGKREVLVDGVPNRIYRGRIVEELRGADPHAIRDDLLGRRIRPGFRSSHLPWVRALLRALADDGLVALRRRGSHIAAKLQG